MPAALMMGREYEATYEQNRERGRWHGTNVDYNGGVFSVEIQGWQVSRLVPLLREAGFRYNTDFRSWDTKEASVVGMIPELVRKSKGTARAALKRELRLQVAKETYARAAERMLEPGDLDRVKARLTQSMTDALRQGVAMLSAADDDRASVRNNLGWSKAHTELGHTLNETGISKMLHAALALKVLWPYRGQLPAALVADAYPVDGPGIVEEEVTPATEDTLTLAQASELVALPAEDALAQLKGMHVMITDAHPEQETKGPPFLRLTRLPLARVEGGATLLLVSNANRKPQHLEVRLAA